MWTPEQQKANKEAIRGVEQQLGYWHDVVNTAADAENAMLRGNYRSRAQVAPVKAPGAGVVVPPKSKGSGNNAAQEAAAQLSADLAEITRQRDAFLNTYKNSEAVLQAMRSAGLTEEGEYFREKGVLMDKQTQAEVNALQKTIERLQQEQLSGKDAINNLKQVENAQAELAKVRENSAAQSKIFSIEESAAYKNVAASILSARQAAQGLLDTMNQGFGRQLAGIGQGNKFREYQNGLQQIDEQFQRQRQDLQNIRAQAEMSGPLGPEAQKKFSESLALITEFHGESVDAYKGYYSQLEDAQKNWLNGATEALYNYRDEAMNVAKNTEEAFAGAFKGLEDQFTNLFTGKGFDAKKLLEDFQADITRNFVKENITGPLAGMLGDTLGFSLGGASGAKLGTQSNPMYVKMTESLGSLMSGAPGGSAGGGWMSSLIGAAGSIFGGFSTGTGASIASALPGDSMDNFLKLMGNFGGARANGGPVELGKFYQVGERGSELFNVNGAQYLIPGANGSITPNHRMGGQGFSQVNNFTVQGSVDRRTQDQMASEIRRRSAMSMRLA
ncbi:MAG: hypothetical protein EOO27_07080 [Comamonadaceae bacterium]|nr:MAG: hypothetical protein EOO27_07080 [Comamonadaceae bacterium]